MWKQRLKGAWVMFELTLAGFIFYTAYKFATMSSWDVFWLVFKHG